MVDPAVVVHVGVGFPLRAGGRVQDAGDGVVDAGSLVLAAADLLHHLREL